MQDSTLNYQFTSTGSSEVVAAAYKVSAAMGEAARAASGIAGPSAAAAKETDNLANKQDRNTQSTNRASAAHENYFVHIAKTTIQSALVNKAFLGLADAAGQAVKQTDLIAQFPAQMAALGLSSKDASTGLATLRTYVQGVGGDLVKAASTVTRFAGVTKNVHAAVIEYAGLNNALIAGGGNAEVQASALEQLTQAYSRGRPQAIEFKSALVAMQPQLDLVAKKMGFVNGQQLGQQLTTGKVSMQDFMTTLTQLSTNGGPIAKQVAAQMTGIGFASNQLKASLVNGLTAIYEAVGRENIVNFLRFLTQVVGITAQYVVILINDLISLFNVLSGVFNGPQIKHFSGEAAGAAAALDNGAGAAGDMADGLGNAADNAQKINKSLASFDKMNVLPDKTNGKTPDATPQTGLDPATAAALDKLYGGLAPNLKAASEAAKIFAGILSALAGNALISKLFGVNPLKELISGIGQAAKGFLGLGKNAEDAGAKTGKSFATKFGEAASTGVKNASSAVAGAIGGVASTAAGAIGTLFTDTIGPALLIAGNAILDAFLVFAGGVAVALSVPLDVAIAIIAAVVLVIVGIIYLIWTNWQTIWGWIKDAFNAVVAVIVAVWNTLFAIFEAPVKFIWQFITAIFILIVAIIATALQLIFDIVVGAILLVYNVLAAIAGWIYNNVIKPVADFFVALWQGVVNAVVAAWQWIYANVLQPIGSWVYNNVILPIGNFFAGLWHTISGFFTNIYHDITGIMAPIFNWININVIQPIANIFSGLWNGLKTGLSAAFDFLKNTFGSLGGVIKAPINGVIDLINDVLKQLNKVKVPDWVPGLGGKGVNFPMIPKLAKGGVVNQATMAIIGESGSEAVMPLENNTGWIDTLAAKLNERAGDGQPVQLVVQIGEDKVVSKVINLINEKTNMSGRNVIYV